MPPPATTNRRLRMSVSDKLKIIADSNVRLAVGESLKSICRLHHIQPSQLRDWRRNVGKLALAKKSLKSLHKGFRGRLHNHEEELVAWVLEMREQQGVRLCYKDIVIQAIAMDEGFGELSFESQYHAVRRLCRRNGVTIWRRRATHAAAGKDLYDNDHAGNVVEDGNGDHGDKEEDGKDDFEEDYDQYVLV